MENLPVDGKLTGQWKTYRSMENLPVDRKLTGRWKTYRSILSLNLGYSFFVILAKYCRPVILLLNLKMTDGGRKLTIASLSDKVEKLTETISLFQRNTADKLSILVNEIQEVRKSQEFLNEKYEEMNEMSSIKQTNKELQTESKYLKETLLGLKSQNEALELSVNELEQYSRRPCLEFQGIPYTKDESTDEPIVELAQKIDVNICNSDTNISHRLARPTNSNPNPGIIAKFHSHMNVRSLSKNLYKLKNFLLAIEHCPDVIAITETKLKNSKSVVSYNLQLEGCDFIHTDTNMKAGGVGFYI